MPCYSPRPAFALGLTATGKTKWCFASRDFDKRNFPTDLPSRWITIGCGLCVGCRLRRCRDWTVRCVHEASLHSSNLFVTLTYEDSYLPEGGNLDPRDLQKFFKRLRVLFCSKSKKASRRRELRGLPWVDKIRFYASGEYGEKFQRPHYHAILFGVDFPDKSVWSRSQGTYVSDILDEVWGKGFCVIGSVTKESASYVTGYIHKKFYGSNADSHYEYLDEYGEYRQREREFSRMSRKPGVAKDWFSKFALSDVYNKDFLTIDGKEFRPPRYYDRQFELENPSEFAKLRSKRISEAVDNDGDRWERLAREGKVAEIELSKRKRSFEHGD